MGELVNLQFSPLQIFRALEKLETEHKLSGAPNFNDPQVFHGWLNLVNQYPPKFFQRALTISKGLGFFPKIHEFKLILEDGKKAEHEEKFREAHAEAARQAEKVFELAISTSPYPNLETAREKNGITKLGFYWVRAHFKNMDEFRGYFQNEIFRIQNKEKMIKLIKEYHERFQEDEEFKKKVLKFQVILKPQIEEYNHKKYDIETAKLHLENIDPELKKCLDRMVALREHQISTGQYVQE